MEAIVIPERKSDNKSSPQSLLEYAMVWSLVQYSVATGHLKLIAKRTSQLKT